MPHAEKITVTGATGFIAAQTISDLLARGYQVRGTVRSLKRLETLGYLTSLPGAGERLELVEADLMSDGSFDRAVAGADAVFHMASPYVLNAANPQKELVEPALKGTLNVLTSCAKAPSVKRVVLTSSMAAVTDEPDSSHVLTEADWNTKSSLSRNPYYYSKTMAEKAAWDFVKDKKPGFDLVVINPFLVIGPSLSPGLNTSNQVFVDLLNGTYPVLMDLTWGFVDVRDVAKAHIHALEIPSAAGRYLCAADTVSMRDVVAILKPIAGPKAKLPSLSLDNGFGTSLMKLASYAQPTGVGSYLRSHLGRTPRYDTSKIRKELGLSFRDVRNTIVDTIADLRKSGHLPDA